MLTCRRITDRDAIPEHRVRRNAPEHIPQSIWQDAHPQQIPAELGWYRGKHAGWIEAVLALQELGHTRIAAKLQKYFGLNDDGSIG